MKTARRFVRRHSGLGFTLVEILIAMALGMIVMGVVLTAYITCWKGFIEMGQYQQAHQDARLVMERISREIRAANAITSFASNDITVTVPTAWNATGAVTTTNTVRYYVTGCQLVRVLNGAATDMIGSATINCAHFGINSLTFTMYDSAGNVTSTTSAAKRLQVVLVMDYSNETPARTDTSSINIKLRTR